ncbi:unnamed protein product [Trichobilharzia regenti]|nr:unnamed protein product [Trichobilharzia regenti]
MSQCPAKNLNLICQSPSSYTSSGTEIHPSTSTCQSTAFRNTLPGVGSFLDKANSLSNYSPIKQYSKTSDPISENTCINNEFYSNSPSYPLKSEEGTKDMPNDFTDSTKHIQSYSASSLEPIDSLNFNMSLQPNKSVVNDFTHSLPMDHTDLEDGGLDLDRVFVAIVGDQNPEHNFDNDDTENCSLDKSSFYDKQLPNDTQLSVCQSISNSDSGGEKLLHYYSVMDAEETNYAIHSTVRKRRHGKKRLPSNSAFPVTTTTSNSGTSCKSVTKTYSASLMNSTSVLPTASKMHLNTITLNPYDVQMKLTTSLQSLPPNIPSQIVVFSNNNYLTKEDQLTLDKFDNFLKYCQEQAIKYQTNNWSIYKADHYSLSGSLSRHLSPIKILMLCRENRCNVPTDSSSNTRINHQLNCLFSPWFPNAVVTDSSLDCLHMTSDSITAQSVFQFAARLQRLHLTNTEFGPFIGVILFTPERSNLLDIDFVNRTQNLWAELLRRYCESQGSQTRCAHLIMILSTLRELAAKITHNLNSWYKLTKSPISNCLKEFLYSSGLNSTNDCF